MRSGLLMLLLAVPLASAVVSLPPPGESPPDWSCDPDVRVCAGAATGGNVDCSQSGPEASCSWTYGWLTRAWGAKGEPGTESHAATFEVTRCSSLSGCRPIVRYAPTGTCTWTAMLACDRSEGPFDGFARFPLAIGECVVVSVASEVWIEARVEGLLAPVQTQTPAQASFRAQSDNGDAVCLLDDGR